MTNDVKISLTINVAGSTRHCLGMKRIPYVVTKQDLCKFKLPIKERNKVVLKGVAEAPEYEYKKAQIHINMYRAAYEYMISDEKPEKYYKKDWRKLTDKQKLDWHMAYIASSYNSDDFSYNILDD